MSDFALYVGGVFALIVATGLPYQGKTWYFCSDWCRDQFKALQRRPDQRLGCARHVDH